MSDNNIFDSGETVQNSFDVHQLAENVFNSFKSSFRENTSIEEIKDIINSLNLSDKDNTNPVPRLRIRRLQFSGKKILNNGTNVPINYDQSFQTGVNLVLIENNNVGKSSILKTIKFALTGDYSDYDNDVRSWITHIWLVFALDNRIYTIIIENTSNNIQAILVPHEALESLEYIAANTPYIFNTTGVDNIKSSLKDFFFHNLGLKTLSWNQRINNEASSERSTTWLTYFQALRIADNGYHYLICDTQHAMGNQDGLILSTFLNLSLTETLNKLGTEISQTNSIAKQEKQLSEQEQLTLQTKIKELKGKIQQSQVELTKTAQEQKQRRALFTSREPVQQLIQFQEELITKKAEINQLEDERTSITSQIKQSRSAARRYREQVALALHFTGLTVSLCPNCDSAVSNEAILREQVAHECRLCGTSASMSSADELEVWEAEAKQAEQQAEYLERGRIEITARIKRLQQEIDLIEANLPILKQALDTGIDQILPTEEEQNKQEYYLIEIGKCEGEISVLESQLSVREPDINLKEKRIRILEKIRDLLRDEAKKRNINRIDRLTSLTQELVTQIGVESISNLTCTPLGKIQMRKHGVPVTFTSINNEGERLRLKLAFFIAMMRLGCEPGIGRHPGFLLIDQPGSSEMVTEDFKALADIFYQVDQQYANEMQIICFTARTEFSVATEPSKIYGAQNPPYAF